MPDKITADRMDAPTHWAVETYTRGPQGTAKTACGRTMTGQTGGTIAPGISCERCKVSMRREGWLV